jgi:hypothetical protein
MSLEYAWFNLAFLRDFQHDCTIYIARGHIAYDTIKAAVKPTPSVKPILISYDVSSASCSLQCRFVQIEIQFW